MDKVYIVFRQNVHTKAREIQRVFGKLDDAKAWVEKHGKADWMPPYTWGIAAHEHKETTGMPSYSFVEYRALVPEKYDLGNGETYEFNRQYDIVEPRDIL